MYAETDSVYRCLASTDSVLAWGPSESGDQVIHIDPLAYAGMVNEQ